MLVESWMISQHKYFTFFMEKMHIFHGENVSYRNVISNVVRMWSQSQLIDLKVIFWPDMFSLLSATLISTHTKGVITFYHIEIIMNYLSLWWILNHLYVTQLLLQLTCVFDLQLLLHLSLQWFGVLKQALHSRRAHKRTYISHKRSSTGIKRSYKDQRAIIQSRL